MHSFHGTIIKNQPTGSSVFVHEDNYVSVLYSIQNEFQSKHLNVIAEGLFAFLFCFVLSSRRHAATESKRAYSNIGIYSTMLIDLPA